jgi:hypothetical protein
MMNMDVSSRLPCFLLLQHVVHDREKEKENHAVTVWFEMALWF